MPNYPAIIPVTSTTAAPAAWPVVSYPLAVQWWWKLDTLTFTATFRIDDSFNVTRTIRLSLSGPGGGYAVYSGSGPIVDTDGTLLVDRYADRSGSTVQAFAVGENSESDIGGVGMVLQIDPSRNPYIIVSASIRVYDEAHDAQLFIGPVGGGEVASYDLGLGFPIYAHFDNAIGLVEYVSSDLTVTFLP